MHDKTGVMGKKGLTLVELMIVVAITAVLAAIAVPMVSSYRNKARIVRIGTDLKHFKTGFTSFNAINGCYPPDSHNDAPNNLKNGYGTEDFLPLKAWVTEPYWGGFYNWEGPDSYTYAGISLFGTTASESTMIKLDAFIDDGNLNTGAFKKTPNGRYTYIVDENPENACP